MPWANVGGVLLVERKITVSLATPDVPRVQLRLIWLALAAVADWLPGSFSALTVK